MCGWVTPDRGGEWSLGVTILPGSYWNWRVYLRPAVEAGGTKGESLEREMGKGEELMMTK